MLLIVPVDAQDQVAPAQVGRGQPYLLDGTRPFYVGEDARFIGFDTNGGRDFPALPEAAGAFGTRALGGHSAPALFTGEILR